MKMAKPWARMTVLQQSPMARKTCKVHWRRPWRWRLLRGGSSQQCNCTRRRLGGVACRCAFGEAAGPAAASAADPARQPANGGAGGSQLPLPAGQPPVVRLAPPSLAGGLSRSEALAATVAAAAQTLSLGLPPLAGVPTASMALAAATGSAAAGPSL